MESSPVATPEDEGWQHGDHGFPNGSPSVGTPVVELVMPMPKAKSPAIAKRKRVSIANASRDEHRKRARCVVGSPAARLINQMVAKSSPIVLRSPTGAKAQNSHGKITNSIAFSHS